MMKFNRFKSPTQSSNPELSMELWNMIIGISGFDA
ncbi:uncharacterized protein METZ01_LOCUS510610, partial [marine metagenome]